MKIKHPFNKAPKMTGKEYCFIDFAIAIPNYLYDSQKQRHLPEPKASVRRKKSSNNHKIHETALTTMHEPPEEFAQKGYFKCEDSCTYNWLHKILVLLCY